jgi:hypothetical protein
MRGNTAAKVFGSDVIRKVFYVAKNVYDVPSLHKTHLYCLVLKQHLNVSYLVLILSTSTIASLYYETYLISQAEIFSCYAEPIETLIENKFWKICKICKLHRDTSHTLFTTNLQKNAEHFNIFVFQSLSPNFFTI